MGIVADKATEEEGSAAAVAADEDWGEVASRGLMDEMFMLGQQRFAREAGGDNLKFETLVSCSLLRSLGTAILCVCFVLIILFGGGEMRCSIGFIEISEARNDSRLFGLSALSEHTHGEVMSATARNTYRTVGAW